VLALIPIIGPIIEGLIGPLVNGVVSIFTKVEDTKVETYKTDADVAKTEISASTTTLNIFKDDWGVRLARDLILFPTSAHIAIYIWDRTVAISHPNWVVGVLSLDAIPYLTYAVLAFLFGLGAMNIWKFK
jgi:hypothetical protein